MRVDDEGVMVERVTVEGVGDSSRVGVRWLMMWCVTVEGVEM